MKLVTFATGGQAAIGRVEGDIIIPLPQHFGGMIDLIIGWPGLEQEVRYITARDSSGAVPLKQAILLPPIPRPGKILAIGLNYADHVREIGGQMPSRQIWFCKQPTAANGPYDPILLPKVASQIDYEAELVAVIGRGGRHIAVQDAHKHVFGYCVGNDVSARDWQMATSQWVLGKSFDTHAPFGPWITTADEIGDPHGLGVRCFVNGEKRQDSDTSNFVFNLWEQIAHVSSVMTLEPGDLIFTGTPGGVGMAFDPPRYLNDGDVVRIEIDRLGALEAVCKREE